MDDIKLIKTTEILVKKFMEDTEGMPLDVVLSTMAYMVALFMHCAPDVPKSDLFQAFSERVFDAHRYLSESCNDSGDSTLQ